MKAAVSVKLSKLPPVEPDNSTTKCTGPFGARDIGVRLLGSQTGRVMPKYCKYAFCF